MDKGYRILLHSEKNLASIETVSTKTLGDGCKVSHPGVHSRTHIQSEENERKQIQPSSSKDSNSLPTGADEISGSHLKLIKNPVTGKLTLMYHSSTHANKENKGTTSGGTALVEDNKSSDSIVKSGTSDQEEKNIPGVLRVKRRRGRPRKVKGVQIKEEEEIHHCTQVIQTNSRTVYLKGECNCLEKQIQDKSSVEELGHVSTNIDNAANENKQKDLRDNADSKEYVTASSRIRDQYRFWRKNYSIVGGKEALPEYKIRAIERTKRQKEIRQSQRYSVFRTWESVMACKDRVEEETRSKYTLYSKSPGFWDDRPKPGKRVLFELKRSKGDSAVVPYTGVPLMWIGSQVYACHLSKHKRKYEEKQNKEKIEGISTAKNKRKKNTPSKHIGCPATFSVTKVARFPDFEVNDESKCKATVSAELRKAWLHHPEKVRFCIKYYVKRPRLEDHQGHFSDDVKISSKFQEPIDPKILQKIHDLTKEGIMGAKQIREILSVFIKEELFKDSEPPPPDRRRYNPSSQDIRNAMKKARLELQRAGKSILQIQCSKLIRDIGDITKSISNEDYLHQLKEHLTHLHSTVREGATLQPLLACHSGTKDQSGLSKEAKSNANAPSFTVSQVKERTSHYSYSVSETEQATQVLYKEELQEDQEMKLDDGVTQIYYYHQIAPGEEVYATEVVDTPMQQ